GGVRGHDAADLRAARRALAGVVRDRGAVARGHAAAGRAAPLALGLRPRVGRRRVGNDKGIGGPRPHWPPPRPGEPPPPTPPPTRSVRPSHVNRADTIA